MLNTMRIELIVFAVAVLAGCRPAGDPVSSSSDPPGAPTPHVSRVAQTFDGNVLVNGSFESRDDNGQPVGWVVWPAGAVINDPRGDYDAFDGERTALIRTIHDDYATLNQYLSLTPKDAGRILYVSAQGRAPFDLSMYLSLEYKVKGENRTAAERKWPASPDNWHPVAFEAPIPLDADAGTVRVRVVCAKCAGHYVRIDDVRAVFEPSEPVANAPE